MTESPIAWFNSIHWNPMTRYEPVGTEVMLLTESMKLIKGVRKEPTKSKNDPSMFFSVETGEPLFGNKQPIMWSYL